MNLKWHKIIGIDISSCFIKAFKVNRTGSGLKWGIYPIPDGLIEQDRIVYEELLAKHLQKMLADSRIKGKKCSLCLPSQHIITRKFLLPYMRGTILRENIYYEMREYLAMDIKEYAIDYRVLRQVQNKNINSMEVMAAAIPIDIVLSYLRMLKLAGLKPCYIDIPSNCMEKLTSKIIIDNAAEEEKEENLCLVDVGHNYSKIMLLHKGVYFADKIISFGSTEITSIISKHYDFEQSTSGQGSWDNNFLTHPPKDNLAFTIQTSIEGLIGEIFDVIRFYQNQVKNNKLHRILLLGEGALLKNLPDFIEQKIKMPVSLFPHRILPNTPFMDQLEEDRMSLLGNAAGSVIRMVE